MKDIKIIESKNTREYKHIIKRVAAYARVSTKQEMQESSLDIQVRHYAKEIIFHPDYIFAGIYYDHGKSGTSMKKRDGLQALLKKVYAGHIDLVLVKSLSRFARNTIDALKIIQETRKLGVEFFFEKENLSSLDTTIDMILTMMAGLAEAESMQISTNIQWGHRSRAKNGKIYVHKAFGYTITKEKKYIVNETEAIAIRKLFQMKLEDKPLTEMLAYLQMNHHKTSAGNPFVNTSQVRNILLDEKYTGKAIFGKTFTRIDGREKKVFPNNGEQPKYIVNNHHEAIIDIETFNAVQKIFDNNKKTRKNNNLPDINLYKKFVYSIPHDAYLYRKRKHLSNKQQDLLENDYFRKSGLPRFYVKHVSKVLLRSLNALSRKFSRMEALFDEQADNLLSKKKQEIKLKKQEQLIENYMRQYYKIERKTSKDKKDRMMLYELETLIIQESMKYTQLEDEYNYTQEHYYNVQNIKKHIQSLKYPIKELTPENVNNIFSNFLIVDYNQYVAFINVSGKTMTPEIMKNAAAHPTLHTGIYNTKGKYNVEIKWKIVLC